MNKSRFLRVRLDESQQETVDSICEKLGVKKSEGVRLIIDEFGKAMGIIPGKPTIRVTVEKIGELPY